VLTVRRPFRLGAAALWGAAICLCASAGFAQQPTGSSAPSAAPAARDAGAVSPDHTFDTHDGRHHDLGEASQVMRNGAPQGHLGGGHIADPHRASEEQQALHEAIRKKFKQFDAAMKKNMADRIAEQHRQEARQQARPRTAVAMADPPSAGGRADGHAMRRPVAMPRIPDAVRQVSVADPPRFPHAAPPQAKTLGGPAPYDPKKSTALSGSAVHRRL
jgi:hypothetical protein